jgi:aminoglycoside phosphotransferase (APT) family kinase protein
MESPSAAVSKNRAYLQERHANWRVPKEALNGLLESTIGTRATTFEQIIRGADNEVYCVTLANGQSCYIRIMRSDRDDVPGGVHEEVWCLEACRQTGTKVPEVLGVGAVRDGDTTLDALVLSTIPGIHFSETLPQISADDKRKVWNQIGEQLSRIHDVKAGGFYRWNPDGEWDFASWEAACDDSYTCRSREMPQIVAAGFPESDVELALSYIRRYKEEFGCDQPVLCHGDIRPSHVLVDTSLNVTGIVDFGMYTGDHPVQDFAYISTENKGMMPDGLLEGYGRIVDERFELRLHYHLVAYLIGYLAYHIQIPNHPETPELIRNFADNLNWLKANA